MDDEAALHRTEPARSDRVVARSQARARRTATALAWVTAGQCVLWTAHLMLDYEASRLGIALVSGLLACTFGLTAVNVRRLELVLTQDHLELRRPFRPVRVPRESIADIRGTIPGRLSWSEQVVVDDGAATIVLPALDPVPVDLVPLLREWAGLPGD